MASTILPTSSVPIARADGETSFTESRAARELQLRRGEFELAVQLGSIRTCAEPTHGPELPGMLGPRWRVDRTEIDRLQAAPGFPETLRASVRTDSATQGARQMSITVARFTRLARLGLLVPVTFYVNRYRTVVWLYLAEELAQFAAAETNKPLLTRPLPETMRMQLDTGLDLRPRSWRARYVGILQRLAAGPWARAAAAASLLDEDEVADLVDDPHERACLAWLKPQRPDHSPPGSPAAQVVDELLTADHQDEIDLLRDNLTLALAEARNERPAPRFALSALSPKTPYDEPAQPGRSSEEHADPSTERTDRSAEHTDHNTGHAEHSAEHADHSDEQASQMPSPRPRRLLGLLRRDRDTVT